MKKKKKKWIVLFSILMIIGIGTTYALTTSQNQIISETEVRNQLQSLYGAEVAEVRKTKDVYTAVITKSGSAYLVEMNPKNGEIFSLQPTEELSIKKYEQPRSSAISATQEEGEASANKRSNPNLSGSASVTLPKSQTAKEEKPDKTTSSKDSTNKNNTESQKKEMTTVENQQMISETPKDNSQPSSSPEGATETAKPDTNASSDTSQSITEEKQNEITSIESDKVETGADSKKENEQEGDKSSMITSTNEVSITNEKNDSTKPSPIYIKKKKAIWIALDQFKGTFEKVTFEKTKDGGFYLVTLKDVPNEKESKEKQKATIQIHAISGKILSVTWE